MMTQYNGNTVHTNKTASAIAMIAPLAYFLISVEDFRGHHGLYMYLIETVAITVTMMRSMKDDAAAFPMSRN